MIPPAAALARQPGDVFVIILDGAHLTKSVMLHFFGTISLFHVDKLHIILYN